MVSERVSWNETRPTEELFLVIAEREPDGKWIFSERNTWEIRWYDIPATSERIEKAKQLLLLAQPKRVDGPPS